MIDLYKQAKLKHQIKTPNQNIKSKYQMKILNIFIGVKIGSVSKQSYAECVRFCLKSMEHSC